MTDEEQHGQHTHDATSDIDSDLETETIVVTTEQGVVLTGTRVAAFEGRMSTAVRRPFLLVGGLLFIMFILMVGAAFVVSDLGDTIHNTDEIVTAVAGPEARKASAEGQSKVIEDLLKKMNCQDQRNLRRFMLSLAETPQEVEAANSFVETQCQVDPTQTSVESGETNE